MKFGLFSSAQANSSDLRPGNRARAFATISTSTSRPRRSALQSSFLVEHHFTGWNQVSATLMLLMALAMRTKTLRLGSAVMVLPWHNPVLLAEQAATLDLVSGGRFDFGIGKGYRHSEFKGFQIAPEEAEARFEEAVEVMTRAFTTRERFSHRGRFWHFEDIVVEPPPAQQPHPPFWVAAGSEHVDPPRRGARLQSDPRSICQRGANRRAHRHLQSRAQAHGSAFDPMQVAVARQLYVANDEADKQAALVRQAAYTKRTVDVSRKPDGKGGSHVLAYADKAGGTEENALFGTPDEICAMLEALRDAGVDYVLLDHLRRPRAAAPFRARDHAGLCAFRRPRPTPRNDAARDGRHPQTARCHRGRAGDPLGARRRQDVRSRRPRHQARHRPRRAMGCDARSFRAFRRHALRAGGARALGEGRHAARRDRSAGRGEQPGTRLRADGLWARCLAARPAPAPSAA